LFLIFQTQTFIFHILLCAYPGFIFTLAAEHSSAIDMHPWIFLLPRFMDWCAYVLRVACEYKCTLRSSCRSPHYAARPPTFDTQTHFSGVLCPGCIIILSSSSAHLSEQINALDCFLSPRHIISLFSPSAFTILIPSINGCIGVSLTH
jgi:hypothetical protein